MASTDTEYQPGQRVQAHPATDPWMMGDCYGTVVRTVRNVGRMVVVKMDRSGKERRFFPDNIMPV